MAKGRSIVMTSYSGDDDDDAELRICLECSVSSDYRYLLYSYLYIQREGEECPYL